MREEVTIFACIFFFIYKKKGGGELPYDCIQSYVCNMHVLHTEDTERGYHGLILHTLLCVFVIYIVRCCVLVTLLQAVI